MLVDLVELAVELLGCGLVVVVITTLLVVVVVGLGGGGVGWLGMAMVTT